MPEHPLYAIASTGNLGERLLPACDAALRGGAAWLQYRDKTPDTARRQREAQQLRERCHQHKARLIINDDLELALTVGADGVHLGQGDGDPAQARRQLGADAIIGVTCHDSLELAERALEAGASYVAFGRFFPSRTKPEAPPAPLALLTEARQRFGAAAIVAIGGITLDNGGTALRAGADRLAVSDDLFTAADIESRAKAYGRLPTGRTHHSFRGSIRG